jgi:hypothetical protein
VVVLGLGGAACTRIEYVMLGGGGAAGSEQGGGGTGGTLPGATGAAGSGAAPGCTGPGCGHGAPGGGCDGGLALEGADAMDGARAIGLCQVAEPGNWGVVSAEWVRSDGQPLTGALLRGKGILDHFGPLQPREGVKMLAISSGSARNPGEPDFNDPQGDWKDYEPHGAPAGYPKESPSCPGIVTGEAFDSSGLRLRIRTPEHALSFSFDFVFYTYEYPDYICSEYNDHFVALLTPTPAGLPDANISFDGLGNTISVNAGFLRACNDCQAGGKSFTCDLGYGEVLGTGFDSNSAMTCPIQGSASTSWLVTSAPIEEPGGEITLHFAIWDSGDGILDSTTLIDNFRFDATGAEVGTIPVAH